MVEDFKLGGVNMEFANFTLNFMQIFTLVLVLSLVASFVFRNHKELVSIISNLFILIMINYFVFTQKDFIYENFPKQTFVMVILLLIMYFAFFRSVYSYIKGKKSEGVSTMK